MPLSSPLPKNHNKPVPGVMRFLSFAVCVGALHLLCLLYFTDMMNNCPPLVGVIYPRGVPAHPFHNRINKLSSNIKLDSSINSKKEKDNSRNNVNLNRRQAKKSLHLRILQDFQHEWLRQRRARVDWKNIIKPCADNMAWGSVKEHWGKTNRSNATTSDIIFKDIRPAGEFSKIFIQSKTSDNRTKLIGGDTWRVYVRGPTSIAATVFDHNNGTYEALFLITEPGLYELMIYLDYSLCDGFKDPPSDWFVIGYRREGELGPLDEYLVTQSFNNGQPAITINVTKDHLKVPISGM